MQMIPDVARRPGIGASGSVQIGTPSLASIKVRGPVGVTTSAASRKCLDNMVIGCPYGEGFAENVVSPMEGQLGAAVQGDGVVCAGPTDDRFVQRLATHRTKKDCRAEGEDAPVGGHLPVAVASESSTQNIPTIGLFSVLATHRTVEGGVSEGEQTPPSEATSQYPPPSGGGIHADDGLIQLLAAHGAEEAGIPQGEQTPPSEATSQYPPPSGVAVIPTMGSFSGFPPMEP